MNKENISNVAAVDSSFDSNKFPLIILGTFKIKDALDIENAIDHALKVGYRGIDTASVYKNESHIGNALSKLLKKHNLSRRNIFITTKLGPKDLGKDNTATAIDLSLAKLNLEYIDLFLIHWPGKQGLQQNNPLNKQFRKESWLELENILKTTRKIKHLGVSNYQHQHLLEMLDYATILPDVIQNEYHPDYKDSSVLEFCKEHNIHFQAYSPLGASHLCHDERFKSISEKYDKSISQILLKWILQKGFSIVPKSKTVSHIYENFCIFDFDISEADMKFIDNLGKNTKYCWDSKHVL